MSYTSADQARFFDLTYEGFCRAADAGGVVERTFGVARRVIRLRFAGTALVDALASAFEHLVAPMDGEPDLTIGIWDSVSTATPLPLLIETLLTHIGRNRWEMLDKRHVIQGYNGRRIRSVFHFGPHILSTMDRERNLALYWLNDARTLPAYERGYPFSRILSWWLEGTSLQLVHAAAIGRRSGGVLVTGPSGSGKSTCALVCMNGGLQIASDDTCLLDCDAPAQIHSLFGTAKLSAQADLERCAVAASSVTNTGRAGDEKALIYLRDHRAAGLCNQMPLKAILLPKLSGQAETTLEPAERNMALMTLFQSAASVLPQLDQNNMSNLARAAQQVPSYRLNLGTRVAELPEAIDRLLSSL